MTAKEYLLDIGFDDAHLPELFNNDDKSYYQITELMEEYHQSKLKLLGIGGVGNSFKITDSAKEKLDFILGHSIARDFPKTQPTKEWAGAVLDFLEINGFLE